MSDHLLRVGVIFGGLILGSCGSEAQTVGQLWKANCASCHGDQGEGASAATLLNDRDWSIESHRARYDAIKTGLDHVPGHAFGSLSDAQLWGLVNHLREFQASARRERGEYLKPTDGLYASQHHAFTIEPVITSGLSIPWSVDFLPATDGAKPLMLVAERPGTLRLWNSSRLSDPVEGVPAVRHRGQGGLMDVAVHPRFGDNSFIYLAYSERSDSPARNSGMTRIVRARLDLAASPPRLNDLITIFQAKPDHYSQSDIHFGCRIVFDPKDPTLMYFAIGERGSAQFAQDLNRPNGKVYRVRDDGTIPADNPFASGGSAYPAIWSFGHRNPQGLTFDLEGNLWDTEHAPRGGDELNLVQKGRNYGWPTVSYGINYNGMPHATPWPEKGSDIVMPVFVWLPSCAACGLDTVRPGPMGEVFPSWRGDLVAGGLAGQNVDRIRIRDGVVIEREELMWGKGRVRDVVTGPDGSIYIVLNDPDHVVRLVRPAQTEGGGT